MLLDEVRFGLNWTKNHGKEPVIIGILFARQGDEGCPVRNRGHHLLVLDAARPGHRRAGEAGRVLGALDQEPVAVLHVLELVREARVRRAEEGVLLGGVGAEDGHAGVQPQVVPDCRAADAAPGHRV